MSDKDDLARRQGRGQEFKKLGKTLQPYKHLFGSANDIREELREEAEALQNLDDLLAGNFKRTFPDIDKEIHRNGITPRLLVRIEAFACGNVMNRIAADIFYLNYFSPERSEYSNALHRIFDVLDFVYASEPKRADNFSRSLMVALGRNPQARIIFARAASSHEMHNVHGEEKAALAHATVAGFLGEIKNYSDLSSGLECEMNREGCMRETCQQDVEGITNELIFACDAPEGSKERGAFMKEILDAIDDQYGIDSDLGHIFAECMIEKICELQQATGAGFLTRRQNAVVADIAGRVFEWERFIWEMGLGGLHND